ncbi:hypothetical protein TAMA11512_12910 [Selenomonas sp. TAMA-11512]|uniref:hypothetical protein n=1 Tax=Selenomonas sp. TAMA-11512 TaxID=3095337 RepID=UPI003086B6F1|nr:hypothetical protein TAMA11512_12910 [Selenomonas sp. TAMA-11512]
MILDKENMFFDKTELKGTNVVSDVINVGPGESGSPLQIFIMAKGQGTTVKSVKVETGKDEKMTGAVTLATFEALPVKATVPRGNLGFLRATVTGTSMTGTVTGGIVLDDDIAW